MRAPKVIVLLTLVLLAAPLSAQRLTAHRGEVEDAYNFWFYTPSDSLATPQPLIVFLHGQSLCGRDLNRVRRYGPLDALQMGMPIDACILAPQNPGGSWSPRRVMRLVEWACAHHPVDTNRIYLIGMSLGGYGTLDAAGTYPDRFAAAMALCGGSTLKEHCGLNRLPLWIIHGTADRAVGIGASQRVVDAMQACDSSRRLIWTPLQGANHGLLARLFYLPQTYEWLLSHRLDDADRPVSPAYEIDRQRLGTDIYRDIRNADRKVKIHTDNPPSTASTSHYTVRKGDTLSAIARRHHTTVAELCRLNNIQPTTTLRIGRKLVVAQ